MKQEKLLISAFVDGEVESPWKEKMEARVASDPLWKKEADKHLAMKKILAQGAAEDLGAQQRVWVELKGRIAAMEAEKSSSPKATSSKSILFRPLLAAAAAALVVVGTLSLGFALGSRGTTATASDLAEIKVQLPQNFDFKVEGEGQLVQMSNFQGTQP